MVNIVQQQQMDIPAVMMELRVRPGWMLNECASAGRAELMDPLSGHIDGQRDDKHRSEVGYSQGTTKQ